jgi:hypothetical protein
VRSGVTQGSHLDPLLFILFINDVFSCFKSLCILLYADDLKIFFLLPPVILQMRRLNLMLFPSGASTAGCSSTLRKCKSMSFMRPFQYELSGHRLDSVDFICDLGVVLDSKLNFT